MLYIRLVIYSFDIITKQLIIIVGGEPELYCGMAWHGMVKRAGGWSLCTPVCVRNSCPECGEYVLCFM